MEYLWNKLSTRRVYRMVIFDSLFGWKVVVDVVVVSLSGLENAFQEPTYKFYLA